MKQIILTQGRYAIVDDEDFDLVSRYKWYTIHDLKGNFWYARTNIRINGKRTTTTMHRIIMNPENGKVVDHIDGNGLDNRRLNLRVCFNAENCKNKRLNKNNKSGFKGVSWHNVLKKWRVRIFCNGSYFHIGVYHNVEEAAKAYDNAAIEHHGEYARLNFR